MPDGRYPVKLVAGLPVVAAPEEIDINNAGCLRETLAAAPEARRHATVVVDMSRTRFCDSAGLHVLVRAHKRALAAGGELRLVISDAAVLRIFAVTGVDSLIPFFGSLDEALAPAP